jgi:hypothetical protein
VKQYGPAVVSKISQGNHTGIHLGEKARKAYLKTRVLLSSSKDSKAWTQALELLEAIVDSVSKMIQIKTFLERSASPATLSSQTDHSILSFFDVDKIMKRHAESLRHQGSCIGVNAAFF